MRMRVVIGIALSVAIAATGYAEMQGHSKVPLRKDLSGIHREVTTSSKEAQQYFDQGMALFWGFNLEAAIASFAEAAKADPNCAMAWWGQALAWGPHINNPMQDSLAAKSAVDAIQQAQKLADKTTPVERDLIQALAARYAWPPPEDRMPLNVAYADAMRQVWDTHSADADVGALYADAMMNLRPWDLWMADGQPQPGTAEIMATLERVMAMVLDHPGACHFYIHTIEASPFPQLALAPADRLRNRIPGAGHLVHMPAHIDIRLGRYAEARKANERAIAMDKPYIEAGGFYTIYRAHNHHFLTYAAMFEGKREVALNAAREMVKQIPMELVQAFPDFLDAFLGVPYHVMVRFGMWNELLAEPEPPAELPATVAFWRYGRTVALASLNRVPEADAEFKALQAAAAAVPESRLLGNNPVKTVMEIGLATAEGELEYRRGNYDKAFARLYDAVEKDDALKYDEPWGWMMPVRHALGALLLEQGRLAEAEVVYREDLRLHPDNGWALKGLAECFQRTNRPALAKATEAKFKTAWAEADTKIETSCFCRRGGMAVHK